MPHEKTQEIKTRAVETIKYMRQVTPCVTIAKIANALNISWSAARHVLRQLVKHNMIIEIELGGKMLWCLSEDIAAHEIYELKRAMWLIICNYKRKFVSPTTIARLIAADQHAREIYARYVDINVKNIDTLRFIAAVLKDMVGEPIDKGPHKTTYYVPPKLCEHEPRPEDITVVRYKSPYRLVSIRLTQKMYHDLITAANNLGVSIPEIVRMAIAKLISQYKHLLNGHKDSYLKAD